MKIAYIALRGVPLSDGIVQYTDDIARELVKRGHEVTVYTSKRYGNVDGLYDNSYQIVTVPSLPWGFAEKMSLVFFAAVHQLFRKYDIVHFHAMGPSVFAFMSRGKVTIIQSHGVEYDRAKHGSKAKGVLKALEKTSVPMADEILVCSYALHEHFMKKYAKETVTIHNSVNVPDCIAPKQSDLEEYGVEAGGYYLYMARISPEKGLEYLIHAYQKLDTRKKLLIAGPFDESNSYHRLLKEMSISDERILFAGFISGEVKQSLLAGAYSFILPSEIEGFSVALLEAMSYGKCCIVSDIPNNIEAIDKYGISFESKNEASLFEALMIAESAPENVSELGKCARERVRLCFSEKMLVDKTELFYEEVLKRKQQKRRKSNEETRRIQAAVDHACVIDFTAGEKSTLS